MNFFTATWAIFEKDLRLELRSRYAVNSLLIFVASALFLILFSIGHEHLSERLQSAILWVVILFSAAVGLGRAFVSEQERGTIMLLQLNTWPSTVYAGKLLFNCLLILVLNLLAAGAFLVLLGVQVADPWILSATLVMGAVGLAGATTLVAAIIARTANQGPLFAVLTFPLLVPLLATVVNLTREALTGTTWNEISADFLALTGYTGVVITASVLLFEYVWND